MKILAFIIAPGNVIPNAIAIQAHQPDHIICIRTKFDGQVLEAEDEAHSRLKAWIKGSQVLVDEFEDLEQPFPIPHTLPSGYISSHNNVPDIEIRTIVKDNLRTELYSIQDEYLDCDLRFDFLPGAKTISMHLALDDPNLHWIPWYSTESGTAFTCTPSFNVKVHKGIFLGIVDRAWLSGNPVWAERQFKAPPTTKEVGFHRGIVKSLEIEEPGKGNRFADRPISVNHKGFKEKIESLGYTFNMITEDKSAQITISKGDVVPWTFNYLSEIGSPQGFYLERLIHIELWDSDWKPFESIAGLNIIEATIEGRIEKYRNQLIHLNKAWSEYDRGGQKETSEMETYKQICKRNGFNPEINEPEIEELLAAEFDFQHRSDEPEIRYVCNCEIDVLILDPHGVISFDGKAIIKKVDSRIRQNEALQRPQWLRQYQYLVLCSTAINTKLEEENIIHFQRIKSGRKGLLDRDRCYPSPLSKEIELARSFKVNREDVSSPLINTKFINSDRIYTRKDGDYIPGIGKGILLLDKNDLQLVSSLVNLGHIPTDAELYTSNQDYCFYFVFKNIKLRLQKLMNFINQSSNVIFSSVKLDTNTVNEILAALPKQLDSNIPNWVRNLKLGRKKIRDKIRIIITDKEEKHPPGILVINSKSKPELHKEEEKRIADSKEFEKNQRRRKPRRRRGGSKTQPKRGNRGGNPKEE